MPRRTRPAWGLLPAAILISLIPFFAGCSDTLEPGPDAAPQVAVQNALYTLAVPEVLYTGQAADAAQDLYQVPAAPPQLPPSFFSLATPLGSDTLALTSPQGQTKRIFLYGIDSPDPSQPYNREAQEFLARLIAGATLKIVPVRKDYDPYPFYTVAKVYLPHGRSVSAELVAAGFAWYYPRWAPGDSLLAKLQKAAQEKKLGLWADPEPISPWEFRQLLKKKETGEGEKRREREIESKRSTP